MGAASDRAKRVRRNAGPCLVTLAGMRIGLLTASASRAGGGVFEAVVRQAALIRDSGGEPIVFALADPDAEFDRVRFGPTEVRHFAVRGPRQVGYAPGLVAALIAARLDLLHLHGIWMYPSRAGERWARATGRPYMVSPHGMLDPWITARGRWKKMLARRGYERASWARAAALHALTQAEAADIARETGRGDALVIPNAAPPVEACDGPRSGMLYLGRIHPKKNIEALVAAWASTPTAGETLTIAGWGEPAHERSVAAAAGAAGPSVRFVGPVHGAPKQHLLRAARWLVLPSWSEGLPMVVLEGWAAGTPTVMTAECHLPDGFAAGAALRCGHSVEAIGAGLREAWADTEWRRRSAAAQALAGGPFSSTTVAARWTTAYRSQAR